MAQKRTVRYLPKTTSANTQYREITPEELAWVLSEVNHWGSLMNNHLHTQDPDWSQLNRDWWTKRRKTLPKGQHGLNSPQSFCAGVIYNTMYKDPLQRDLSQHQCEGIEEISSVMSELSDSCTEIRFSQSLFE